MNEQYPLTVYFDASCPICHSEILNIKAHDNNSQLLLVDCSASGFSDAPFRRENVSLSDMMTRLHVRDSKGAWIKGTDAMELIYRTVGMQRIARLWERHAPLGRLYPWIARNRQALSLTGIPMLFVLWRKWLVWRMYQKIQTCKNGKCVL